jgi:glycosyltransferase involved in cell wall biosynthesis
MKIAQVAPLYESVPPQQYGGTERVVSFLTEELVRQGHEVTLFASGDSVTNARLYPACDRALRLHSPKVTNPLAYHISLIEMVARKAEDFDLVHFHIDYLNFPVTRRDRIPAITTLHGRLDIPELALLFGEFRDMNLVSISKAQRHPVPWANWVGTVHHGLPLDLIRPLAPRRNREGAYLAFVGRISPEKRPDRAIEIAQRAGMPLKIAAKVDPVDVDYFESEIRPLLDEPFIEFIGEISDREKPEFFGNAHALLFPIDWPEPFGLVQIESMAAGTPIIAYEMGSVREIVEDGVTGFFVHDIDEAVAAVGRVSSLDRRVCRRVFEKRFSVERMCLDYQRIYARVLQPAEPCPAEEETEVSAASAEPLAM